MSLRKRNARRRYAFDSERNPLRRARRWSFRHHGAEGSRTPYLLNAIQALSQLSYSPNTTRIFKNLYETGLTGIEPATSAVTVRHSNQAELQPQTKAGNRVRTGDLHVGNVTLYQLSYSRTCLHTPTGIRTPVAALRTQNPRPLDDGGLCQITTPNALTGNRTPVCTLKECRPNR